MANEVEWTYMASVTLETSGAAVANAAFDSGDGSSVVTAGHGDWPLADFVLDLSTAQQWWASALAGNQVLNVYRREMDACGGTIDETAPAAAYKYLYVGSFNMLLSAATNSTGVFTINSVPLSSKCIFYIENTTGQQLSSGWGLYCRPKSYVPGS